MIIVILRSAIEDLARGREFYEAQGKGLGEYFEDSLPAYIIPCLVITACFPRSSPMPFIMRLLVDRFGYEPFLIVGETPNGLAHDYEDEWPPALRARRRSRAAGTGRADFV